MRRPRTSVTGIVAAVALCVLAGACDTSPVAASVNGTEIKQTSLDQEIRLETANTAYVDAFDRQNSAQGTDVSVGGDAPGTYSARFVSNVLSTLIGSAAVHQALAAQGRSPSPAQLAAARSVDETIFQSLWLPFPAAFRDTQVVDDAEHAMIEPAPSAQLAPDLQQAYSQNRQYFFANVCVRTIAVAVTGADGLDEAASLVKAQAITRQFNLTADDPALKAADGTPQGGNVVCYDGAGLEAQGRAVFDEVLKLAPGQATAPQPTSFGYQVVEVDSRLEQPFDGAVAAALALGVKEVQGGQDPAYEAVLAKAHVSVDPQYGSWNPSELAVQPSSPLGANSTASQPGSGQPAGS